MGTCDFCGSQTEHASPCNGCGQSYCGDHRIPEKHECVSLKLSEGGDGLEGDGPSTRDRRGTGRKRIERVREKETSHANPPSETWEPEERGEGGGRTDVLSCSGCGSSTDRVLECDACGASVCPECEDPDGHDCAAVESDSGGDAGSVSLLDRLAGLFE